MKSENVIISIAYLIGFTFGGFFGVYLTYGLPLLRAIIISMAIIHFFGYIVGMTAEKILDRLSELEAKE